jgi:hypothetical protein
MSTFSELSAPTRTPHALLEQLKGLKAFIDAVSNFFALHLPESSVYTNAHYVMENFLLCAEKVTSLSAQGSESIDRNCQLLLAYGDALFKEDPDRPVQISHGILGPKMHLLPTRFLDGRIQQRHSLLLGELMEQVRDALAKSGREGEEYEMARAVCEHALNDEIAEYAQSWQELRPHIVLVANISDSRL